MKATFAEYGYELKTCFQNNIPFKENMFSTENLVELASPLGAEQASTPASSTSSP